MFGRGTWYPTTYYGTDTAPIFYTLRIFRFIFFAYFCPHTGIKCITNTIIIHTVLNGQVMNVNCWRCRINKTTKGNKKYQTYHSCLRTTCNYWYTYFVFVEELYSIKLVFDQMLKCYIENMYLPPRFFASNAILKKSSINLTRNTCLLTTNENLSLY